jgi:hypothetical protein
MNSEASIRSNLVKVAFEQNTVLLNIDQIVALKLLRPGVKSGKKYAQIISSVRTIGLVESPIVTPDRKRPGVYLLLDGHLRIEALRDLNVTEVECLISTDDEAYTYNKRINKIAAVQEHRMIVRAVDRGVPEERIAEAVSIPRQSRGHYDVSRSKRLFGDADAAPASGPPRGGGHRQRFSCSSRASSFSCCLMYARIASSFRPTVDTKYPLAQKCWPVKFLFRSP